MLPYLPKMSYISSAVILNGRFWNTHEEQAADNSFARTHLDVEDTVDLRREPSVPSSPLCHQIAHQRSEELRDRDQRLEIREGNSGNQDLRNRLPDEKRQRGTPIELVAVTAPA